VVCRTLLGRIISHVYTGRNCSLGNIYPLKRIGIPQKIVG